MNPFTERYKNLSNIDLVRITKYPIDYQMEAVEAALSELNLRDLEENEMLELHRLIELEEKAKCEREIVKNKNKKALTKHVARMIKAINPIQETSPTNEKIIKTLTLILGLISLYNLYKVVELLSFYINEDFYGWENDIILYLLVLLLFPMATILFALGKKLGWIMLVGFSCYALISNLLLLIMTWLYEPFFIPAFDLFAENINTPKQIISLLFYSSTMWILFKKPSRSYFKVERKELTWTMIIVVVIVLWMLFSFF